jgi:DNA invertase Pin-like site-specific DNA recombinase
MSIAEAIAVYVRVSTAGQNEAGQRAAICRWLEAHGTDPKAVKWFIDKSTGHNLERPAFQRLQKAAFAGEAKTVLVFKLSRLSRSLREGVNILYDWCGRGLRVVSVSEGLDFNGKVSPLLAGIFLAFAEMDDEVRKETQAEGIAEAKKRGVYKGRKVGTTKAKAGPRRARELRGKGLSVEEVGRSLGVSRNTVFRYLRDGQDGA